MKYLNKILYLFVVGAILTSCDRDVIDTDLNGRTNTLFYPSASGSLFVEEGAANIFDVVVAATAVASANTPYSISIDDSSTAVEGVDYTMVSTATQLSEGDIVTSFGVMADFDNAEIAGKTVVFNLTSESSSVAETNQFTLNLIKLCPLTADFTGSYTITASTNGIFDSPTFGIGSPATLSLGASQLDRVMNAPIYPGLGSFGNMDFSFSLVCGNVIVPGGQATGVGCGSSTTLGPAATTGSFDATDDSSITVIFTDDEAPSCGTGGGPLSVEFTLTKV